uniref:Hedgehog protein Hint domain-containing protein n=1 Tax=Romanomermis culicivorax TaxID=13658 RepID=A0A915ITU4_ROMCU
MQCSTKLEVKGASKIADGHNYDGRGYGTSQETSLLNSFAYYYVGHGSWTHYEPDIWIVFLHISLENGQSLHITEDHLIFTSHCNSSMEIRKAAKVNVGDCLFKAKDAVSAYCKYRQGTGSGPMPMDLPEIFKRI